MQYILDMSVTPVATLADTWPGADGWTTSAPDIYFNFNSLTAGPVTMTMPNGGDHTPGNGYVSKLPWEIQIQKCIHVALGAPLRKWLCLASVLMATWAIGYYL